MFIRIAALALVCGVEAHRHHHHHRLPSHFYVSGIDKDDLMQNQKAHWRKNWPQGDVDNGDSDEDVMNLKGKGRKHKDPPDVYTYPWTLEPEMVDSAKHLEESEGLHGSTFSKDGW